MNKTKKYSHSLIKLFVVASFFIVNLDANFAFSKNIKDSPIILVSSAVAVPDQYSAATAEKILKEGGNAVDAAVAVAFTLAVTYPEAGNIGGGGFMTLYFKGAPYFLDYRERAPFAATKNMYLNKLGQVVEKKSLYGFAAVGVPGTVAGMWEVHKRFGNLKWQKILAPAIHYAQHGFIVNNGLEKKRIEMQHKIQNTNFNLYFGKLESGKTFKQPELAMVLKRIAKYGPNDFYHGKTSELIIADMQKNHGLITKRDLDAYKPTWRQPIIANWKGYQIITAPPPSSGGVGLIQLLKMKQYLKDDFKNVSLNSSSYIHLVSEMEKRIFADRAQYMGDPNFNSVPVAQLLDETYIEKRAQEINSNTPSDTKKVLPGLKQITSEKTETTHFSIIDKWGNAVSNTYTLNGNFGAGVVVDGGGFLLNNEMDDFSVKPGVANHFGVVGSDANSIAPGKIPLSSMTPTILTRDGKVVLVIGTPGGSRIFTSIFQVITNLYDFNLNPLEAVSAMRFHHQLLPPNTIFWEPYSPITGKLAKQLIALGYTLENQNFNGDIELIAIDGKNPHPVADPRGRGVARIIQ